MPYFTTVHLNQALTNVSVRYNWTEGIANDVFPEVPVQKESDQYFVYSRDHLRLDETIRANRAKSNEVGFDYSTATYRLEEHALNSLVTDRDRANADAPLDLDVDTAEDLTMRLMIRREVMVSDICFTTGSWGNNATVGSATAWNTSASNPISDVLTATASILRQGFIMPNYGVLGWEAFSLSKINSVTTDRIKYTSRDTVTPEILAGLFDLEKILVGKSARVTSAEGAAETTGFIWPGDMLVYHRPPSPKLKTPSSGYVLTIGGRFRTSKWREDAYGGDRVEVSTMFLPVAVATSAAYLLKKVDGRA